MRHIVTRSGAHPCWLFVVMPVLPFVVVAEVVTAIAVVAPAQFFSVARFSRLVRLFSLLLAALLFSPLSLLPLAVWLAVAPEVVSFVPGLEPVLAPFVVRLWLDPQLLCYAPVPLVFVLLPSLLKSYVVLPLNAYFYPMILDYYQLARCEFLALEYSSTLLPDDSARHFSVVFFPL